MRFVRAKAASSQQDHDGRVEMPLGRINASSDRRFGALTPADMLRHLRRTLEPVTGDYTPEADMSNFFTRTALFHTVFLVLPWPKGKVKVPDWLTPPAEGDVESEREKLFVTMDKFVGMLEASPAGTCKNPLLGPVSLKYLGRLQGKHIDHHCLQFGVQARIVPQDPKASIGCSPRRGRVRSGCAKARSPVGIGVI